MRAKIRQRAGPNGLPPAAPSPKLSAGALVTLQLLARGYTPAQVGALRGLPVGDTRGHIPGGLRARRGHAASGDRRGAPTRAAERPGGGSVSWDHTAARRVATAHKTLGANEHAKRHREALFQRLLDGFTTFAASRGASMAAP